MQKINLILALILVSTSVALAQSPERPSAKHGGTKSNPQLIELSNLAGDSEGCVKRGPYVGKLVQRKFDDDEITLIGFVLRDSKDQRTYINLDDEQIDRMLMVDRSYLSTFLAKGKRVKVGVYACGAAGRVLYADRIVASSSLPFHGGDPDESGFDSRTGTPILKHFARSNWVSSRRCFL